MILDNIKYGVIYDNRHIKYKLKNNDIYIYYDLSNISGVTHQIFSGSSYEFIFESDYDFSESKIDISNGPKHMFL